MLFGATMTVCLAGIRVLDLSRILAGPWATQLLADLGTEVIKIERPGKGDDTRGWGPPFVSSAHEGDLFSAYYLAANRGKKSVAVDLSSQEGREIIESLTRSCDILVENFSVGVAKRLGFDYETLSEINPRLIYCSITGFGQTGPHKDKPGYDLLIQAMGGLMSITGSPEGEPTKVGVTVADLLTGLYATAAMLAALNERHSSGLGQHIDLALLDVQIAALANQGMNFLATGKAPARKRQCPSQYRALPGIRDQRWTRCYRGGQRCPVRAFCGCARPSGTFGRSSIQRKCRPRAEPRCADCDPEREDQHLAEARPAACPRDPTRSCRTDQRDA